MTIKNKNFFFSALRFDQQIIILSKKLFLINVLLIGILWTQEIFAQSSPNFKKEKQQLEKERQKLLKEIDLTKKLLDQTNINKNKTLSHLETLQKQIQVRQKIIQNINKEIQFINGEINKSDGIIEALQKDLEELKNRYADMLIATYKNRSALNEIVFIFSARDFNDAFQRVKLVQTLNRFRKKQAELIQDTELMLSEKIAELKLKKNDRLKLLNFEIEQRTQINKEKEEQGSIIIELKKTEKKLLSQIKEQQKNTEKLNKKIEDIIKKEIEAAKRKAELEAKKKAEKGANPLTLTPEAAKLSADFQSNLGKLPWPVERGVITKGFGPQPHPVLKSVMIENNGIDIKTEKNAKARAVFEGIVVNIITVPGMNKAVLIRHGEFFTLYGNLDNLYIKTGEKVLAKQDIGTIHYNDDEGQSELHFETWKSTEKMNPSKWVAK